MEEIKREILSLSEKYSVKCVESAALEERLATATTQLAHAHNHIMQLDSRSVLCLEDIALNDKTTLTLPNVILQS